MATGRLYGSNSDEAGEFIEETLVEKVCEPCMKSNKSKTAKVFCKNCDEYLCDACTNPHRIYKRGEHTIVHVGLDMNGMDICQEHSKKVKFYCEDHVRLCCTTCAILHKECEHFQVIALVSDSPDLGDLETLLISLKMKADLIIDEYKKPDNDLNTSILKLSKDIDTIKDRIIKLFDAAKNKFLCDANALKSEHMNKQHALCLKIKEDTHKLLGMCSDIKQHATTRQKYIIEKRLNDTAGLFGQNPPPPTMALSFPRELLTLLEIEYDLMKLNFNQTTTDDLSPIKFRPKPIKLQLLCSVDLPKNGDDKMEPYLSGVDFLTDDRLVAVDQNNRKCIILNADLDILGTPYTFKTIPFDDVSLSQNEFGVTLNEKTVSIMSVSLENVISMIREISTSSNIYSICCMSSSNMVVSTWGDRRHSRMISVDGVESDFDRVEFSKYTYRLGESKCTYVQGKNILVLIDSLAHTVHMHDTVRGSSSAITHETINQPLGACVAPDDTVLVCNSGMNTIVHMTIGGYIIGTYPVVMWSPNNVCMSKNGSRLVVTSAKRLQLYELSPADVRLKRESECFRGCTLL